MLKSRRGIFLVAVLFMTVVIAMFVGAAISLAPASLGRTAHESRVQIADRAAKTGLAWSQARLRSDPDWNASVTNNTVEPEFIVDEASGQVVGWVKEGPTWSRFRIRFNWQDGVGGGDALNDPPQNWANFTLVSCNNLRQTVPKSVKVADGPGGSVTGGSPTRLDLPQNSALISVEGTTGSVQYDGAGKPIGFAGSPQTRTIEVILKLSGPNQAVTPAAVMAAGDIKVALQSSSPSSKLDLTASATQVTRLRSKGKLEVVQGGSPNVHSSKGELSANNTANVTTNGSSGNVTVVAEQAADGFYSIPNTMVKAPASPATPNAGVYVVNTAGVITYYDMDYSAYQAAVAAGTLSGGTATSLPGVTVSTSATSPKVRMLATQDIQVSPTGSATDFVIIPDGGAPTTNSTYNYAAATANVQNYFNTYNTGWLSPFTNVGANPAWLSVYPNLPSIANVSNQWQYTATNGQVARLNPATMRWNSSGGWNAASAMDLAGEIAQTFQPGAPNAAQALSDYNVLASNFGAPQYTPSASLPPVGTLTPADLQLTLQAPTGGSMVLKNDGNLVLGSQIQGNGAALVSKGDIQLIGTSSDLSSTPGASMGLNLYAEGDVLIAPFKLDSAGAASFHKVDMQGVVYSWGNVTINVGDSSVPNASWGALKLKGALVAFGGDPNNPVPGYAGPTSGGKVSIGGKNADIEFDPSYLMGLYQNLPSPLGMQIVSWHQR